MRRTNCWCPDAENSVASVRRRHRIHQNRRGSILVLTAFLLPVMFILAAFTINLAYLQLTRTEMMVATDAAARAGGRTLSESQDVDLAKEAAEITAALNNVAGSPLQIDADAHVEFGNASNGEAGIGRYSFLAESPFDVQNGDATANAVRVLSERSDGYGGKVVTPFPSFGMNQTWELEFDAVAMQVDRDISLVLDRSGSMSWTTFNWPSGTSPWNTSVYNQAVDAGILTINNGYYYYASGQNSYTFQGWAWENYFDLGPSPNSPWEDLELAVASFLTVLEGTVQSEKVSLASYSTSATLDMQLTNDYQALLDELDTLGPSGMTAIGQGMQAGEPSLFEPGYSRPLAAKTMIVMTDGMHNTGIDPVAVATDIVATQNVTIHSVTFSPGADQVRMKQVADIGGGQHYHANSGDELVEVFQEIANNLPTIITH